MAIAPDTSWDGSHSARPVLGAVTTALDALAGSTPQRLWALGDAEVTEAFSLLARMGASVDAHLVAVLAEAKDRGLGKGDGWGPLDWARAMAPQLPTRTLSDLDTLRRGHGRRHRRRRAPGRRARRRRRGRHGRR